VLLNLFYLNKTLVESVVAPRFISKNTGIWSFEQELWFNQTLMENIQRLNVTATSVQGYGSGAVETLMLNLDGSLTGVADPRKNGASRVSEGTAFP